MESPGPSTEAAKPANRAQASPKKRSPKKSSKKQNNLPAKCTPPNTPSVNSPSKTVLRNNASNLPSNAEVPNAPVMSPSKTVKPNDRAAILLSKLAPKDPVVSLLSKTTAQNTPAVMSPSKTVNRNDPAAILLSKLAPAKDPVVSLPSETTPPNTPAVGAPFKTVQKIDSAAILLSKLAPKDPVVSLTSKTTPPNTPEVVSPCKTVQKIDSAAILLSKLAPKDPVVSLPSKTTPPNTPEVDNPSKTEQKIDSAAILLSKLAPQKDNVASLPSKTVQQDNLAANLPSPKPAPNSAPVKFTRDNPPAFPSLSQPSTSLNNSPRTPTTGVNPFTYQTHLQNGVPFNPNMPQLNGVPYIPRSTAALQEYLVKSLKIGHEASSSTPHVDSLRITVNNDHTRRTVQTQGIPNILGTRTPYQFNFPAAVPFQYDQRTAPAQVGRPRPPLNVQAQGNNNNTNNVATSYMQHVNRKQKGRDYDDEDFFKKVLVMGFPAYTKQEELIRHLSKIGTPTIEIMRNRVAVVTFSTQLEAIAAVNANDTITIYGSILNIAKYTNRRHVAELMKQNRRTITQHVPKGPVVKPPSQIDLKGDFYEQMRNLEQEIRLTQEEVVAINKLFEDIEEYLKVIYKNCEAVPFGSITTGQGIKSSDADCFLALTPGENGRPGAGAAEHSSMFVNKASKLLRLHPKVFSHIVAIPKANTPIIKFLHVPTNMCCDLNSKTPLGVQNSRLLGHFLNADPAGRFGSVALLLKYWAKAHDISGTGKLTNYALTLMLIAYLQKNYLPSVVSLQSKEHSFIIENWEAGFDTAPITLTNVPPMRDILGGFFLYYAGFDFDELVVCPFMGRTMRKAEFDSDVLPPEFELYRYNLKEGNSLKMNTGRCLCIQDPFELSHNVASAVTNRLAAEIRAHISLAAASYNAGETKQGDFLRTILLTRPTSPELYLDTRVATRISLPGRLLEDIDGDWQAAVRETVCDVVYQEMMHTTLKRRVAVSREADVEIEVYVGEVTKPIWMRSVNSMGRCTTAADLVARQKNITGRIMQNEGLPELRVPFEVELGFRFEPRGLTITTTAMDGADPEAFRAFRHFSHTFIHRWFKELLKPHMKKVSVFCTKKNGDVISQQIHPDELAQIRYPKKRNRKNNNIIAKTPIQTVAFVNKNHKENTSSIAAISLTSTDKDST